MIFGFINFVFKLRKFTFCGDSMKRLRMRIIIFESKQITDVRFVGKTEV